MLLQVKDLTVTAQLARSRQTLLEGVGFCVRSGEPLAIIGESGSGKTMLALALLGLLPDNCEATGSAELCKSEGSLDIQADAENIDLTRTKRIEFIGMKDGKKNAMRGREMVYVPQSGGEFLNPALKIKSQMFESLKKCGLKGKTQLYSAAQERLERVGLDACVLDSYQSELSGGQAQRVTIALSLSPFAELAIADEPTKGIDAQTAKLFEDGLKGFYPNACVIVITHSLELAAKCSCVLVLKDGKVVEYGSVEKVFNAPESEYTARLIEDMPRTDGEEYA